MAEAAGGRTLVVITGAAGAFGTALRGALREWRLLGDVDWLLVSRERRASEDKAVTWLQVPDFAEHPNEVSRLVGLSLASLDDVPYSRAFFFNNAGELGAYGVPDTQSMHRCFAVNCVAPAQLARVFAAWPRPSGASRTLKTVVYTSTLGAVSPMKDWTAYCCSKAAGEMAHRVLATEHRAVQWLCYAPGPLTHSAMTREVERCLGHVTGVVDPLTSARKLVHFLKSQVRDSSAEGVECPHIDFFDIERVANE